MGRLETNYFHILPPHCVVAIGNGTYKLFLNHENEKREIVPGKWMAATHKNGDLCVEPIICSVGMHASQHFADAAGYVYPVIGGAVCTVSLFGDISGNEVDKVCATFRRLDNFRVIVSDVEQELLTTLFTGSFISQRWKDSVVCQWINSKNDSALEAFKEVAELEKATLKMYETEIHDGGFAASSYDVEQQISHLRLRIKKLEDRSTVMRNKSGYY